jgi:hypothetical protein
MLKDNPDKIKNIRLVYYKGGKQVKQSTLTLINRRITNILASLNWGKWSRVELTVRYGVGENAMTLTNKDEAMWANTCFIKEYQKKEN